MKMMKKTISVLLSVIFLFSAVSVGVVASAYDIKEDQNVTTLATSFFKMSGKNIVTEQVTYQGFESTVPVQSLVGILDQYDITNTSGDYKYKDDNDVGVRAISYTHEVDAKDDSSGTIRNALKVYLSIANSNMSKTYGQGNYTVPMVVDAVSDAVEFAKDSSGNYIFLDGYSYYADALGNVVLRFDKPTYKVTTDTTGAASIQYYKFDDNGNYVKDASGKNQTSSTLTISNNALLSLLSKSNASSGSSTGLSNIRDNLTNGKLNLKSNLFELCNVKTILTYFSGNCSAVNSGNWYHQFVFKCATDVDYILSNEVANTNNITVKSETVTWTMNRSYDDSGTKAQYYNEGYKISDDTTSTNTIRYTLGEMKATFRDYFSEYYDGLTSSGTVADYLQNRTNEDILDATYGDYNNVRYYFDTFNDLSNAAKINYFGQDAYQYMNLVTQLTPSKVSVSGDSVNHSGVNVSGTNKYLPSRTSQSYTDKNTNQNVTYNVTTESVGSIVSTVDKLMENKNLATILNSFIDFSDDTYAGTSIYGVKATTPKEFLEQIIQNYVFNDDIINKVISFIYPTITNLLDTTITDAFIKNTISSAAGSFVNSLVQAIVNDKHGWQNLIYGDLLMDNDIALTPAGLAYEMQKYGYSSTYSISFNVLKAAKGGVYTTTVNGGNYGDFYCIGAENSSDHPDEYCGNRWKDVDYDQLVWNVNGDAGNFKKALTCVLTGLAPLLAVLLGNQTLTVSVPLALGSLTAKIVQADVYETTILPLLEALGINSSNGLVSPATFRSDSAAMLSNKTVTTVNKLLNTDLIGVLVDWIMNTVLPNPVQTVLTAIPNISYYLTSKALLKSIQNINIKIQIVIAITYDVTTLNVGSLLGDKLDFLTSLNNILKLIGLSAKTADPVVGYTDDEDTTGVVSKPGMANYDASKYNVAQKTAYISDDGKTMSLYQSAECPNLVEGKDSDGNIIEENCILNRVGWTNAAGIDVVVSPTEEQTAEYNVPVYKYYEYKVVTADTALEVTVRKTALPAGIDEEKATLVRDISYYTEKVTLPAIMDYKLQECGSLASGTSLRDGALSVDGDSTWAAGTRYYISLDNTEQGLTLLFLFRYIFSALKYQAFSSGDYESGNNLSLLNAFVTNDQLNEDILYGFSIEDIIDNATLHPDEVIAALYELLTADYANEQPSYSIYDIVQTLATAGVVSGTASYKYSMDNVDYHYSELKDYADEYDDYTYGTSALYTEYWSKSDSQYVVDNLDDLINNVLSMLKLSALDGATSLSDLIDSLLTKYVYQDSLMTTVATALYSTLDGLLDGKLKTILKGAINIDYSKSYLINAFKYEFKDAYAKNKTIGVADNLYSQIQKYNPTDKTTEAYLNYSENTFKIVLSDGSVSGDVQWGLGDDDSSVAFRAAGGYTKLEVLLKDFTALLSPFAEVFKFLFCGEDLTVCRDVDASGNADYDTGILDIPGYEGYQYAWIPLMEALGATDGLESYSSYFEKSYANSNGIIAGNCDCVYYALKPLINLVKKVSNDPAQTLLNIIPNLMFYMSIGGLSDTINNFLHPIYVLLDIIEPIYDPYPVVNSYLANLVIGGMSINLSLPLDFDFNQLGNTLISLVEGFLDEALPIHSKLVLGQYLTYSTQDGYVDAQSLTGGVVTANADGTVPTGAVPIYVVVTDEHGNYVMNEDGSVQHTAAINAEGKQLYVVQDTSDEAVATGHGYLVKSGSSVPIYEQQKDSAGKKLFNTDGTPMYVNTYVPLKDASGNDVYETNDDGTAKFYYNGYEDSSITYVTKDSTVIATDDDGNPIYKQVSTAKDYTAWDYLKISLPYIDFSTLCAGILQFKTSITGSTQYVYLNSSGGADLMTLVLRLVTQTLFLEDNANNIADLLVTICQLDDENNDDEFLRETFTYLNTKANTDQLPDKTLQFLFIVYKYLVPISSKLGDKFKNVDFGIIEFFQAVAAGISSKDMTTVTGYIDALMGSGTDDGNQSSIEHTISGFAKIIGLLKAFFNKIKWFFQSLFGG